MSLSLALSILSLLWLVFLTLLLKKSLSHYQTLSKIRKGVSVDQLLEQVAKLLTQAQKSQTQSDQKILALEQKLKKTISKVGLVKFNPFNDQGGEQSFVLALLDDADSGLLITSLHAREGTRIYVKKLKEGKAQNLQLSKEEKMSILQAVEQAEKK
jgi:hypothetical protein